MTCNLKIAYLCRKDGFHPAHKRWVQILQDLAKTEIIYIPLDTPSKILFLFTLLNKKFDIAVIDGFSPLFMGWFLKKIGLLKKIIYIATSPSFIDFPILSQIFLGDVNCIIAPSSSMKTLIEKLFKFEKYKKIIICHPIPDISQFLRINPSLNSNNICTVGSLSYFKGIDMLPYIMKKIHFKFQDAKLLVIGSGTTELKKVEGMNVYGYVPHSKLPYIFSKCSVYLHPARLDAFSVAVIEAMAAGLIPIVTHMTGAKDIVKEVSPNLIVKANVEELADKLIEVLCMDYNERVKFSEKAKQVAQKFIIEAEKSFIKTLKNLIM